MKAFNIIIQSLAELFGSSKTELVLNATPIHMQLVMSYELFWELYTSSRLTTLLFAALYRLVFIFVPVSPTMLSYQMAVLQQSTVQNLRSL